MGGRISNNFFWPKSNDSNGGIIQKPKNKLGPHRVIALFNELNVTSHVS